MSEPDESHDQISIQEVKIYRALKANRDRWLSNQELWEKLDGVAHRTTREFTRRYAEMGIVEMMTVFPGYRYRLAANGTLASYGYIDRLEAAEAALFPEG